MATATYEKITSDRALIEVTYSNGDTALQRIDRPRHGDLYETAYAAASVKAAIHGETLARFSRV